MSYELRIERIHPQRQKSRGLLRKKKLKLLYSPPNLAVLENP